VQKKILRAKKIQKSIEKPQALLDQLYYYYEEHQHPRQPPCTYCKLSSSSPPESILDKRFTFLHTQRDIKPSF